MDDTEREAIGRIKAAAGGAILANLVPKEGTKRIKDEAVKEAARLTNLFVEELRKTFPIDMAGD